MEIFAKGSLKDAAIRATQRGVASGALQPISTTITYIEEAGVEFAVRRLLPRKECRLPTPTRKVSPFLEPDPALCVADVSATHVCLLNKFPVFENHLLIVTREFEQQSTPLNLSDFRALWKCMLEFPSLGFYNGGTLAGASQRHKHLQIAPLPLAPRGGNIPIEPLLEVDSIRGGLGHSKRLPFRHILAKLPTQGLASDTDAAALTHGLYGAMLRELSLNSDAQALEPYNLLVTQDWLLCVPRLREHFESISFNALAFAGHFLVRNEAECAALKACGPLEALRQVAG